MENDQTEAKGLKIIGMEDLATQDEDLALVESGRDDSSSEQGLPENEDADVEETEDGSSLIEEDVENTTVLSLEELIKGKHSLNIEEMIEMNEILGELHEKSIEILAVEKETKHIIPSHFFQLGANAYIKEREERLAEIVLERILEDEAHTGSRDIQAIYEEMKLLESVHATTDVFSKTKKGDKMIPFSGISIPFSKEGLSATLNNSNTMLSPIHDFVLSILEGSEDAEIMEIYLEETKEMMIVNFYSEDIFNIFPL